MTDFGFLRTIPEDRSQVASSVAASNPSGFGGNGNGDGDDATSVRAVEAGREGGSGSVVSDAMATLAGGNSSDHNSSNKQNKKKSSMESGGGRQGGGGGAGGDGGQARRSDDAGSNIGVLPGTSDISPAQHRRGGRRRPTRDGHDHHSKHASSLEKVFCYWPRSKRKKTCIWILAILVVTAFVLCIVLLTTTDDDPDTAPSPVNNDNSTDNEPPSESLTTISPTFSPTSEATIPRATIELLNSTLLKLTSADILFPPSGFEGLGQDDYVPTPQSQARDWMLHDDLYRDEVLADGESRVLQRYSLVVFFISTGRPDYLNGTQPECEWTGIHCVDPTDLSDGIGGGPGSGSAGTELGGGDLDIGGGGFDAAAGSMLGGEDNMSSSTYNTLQQVVRRIELPSSNLTGTLPSELRILTHLGELHIPDNNVSGVIPSEWFVLVPPPSTGTSPVAAPVNATTSTLPPTSTTSTLAPISTTTPANTTTTVEPEPGLYSFYWFDASRNKLSGTIPPGLWSLPHLRFVYLGNNDLSGPLETLTTTTTTSPTAVDSTTNSSSSSLVLSTLLQDVRLNDNRLSGTIPSWLLSRPTLRAVVVNNNQFNGSLLSSQEDVDGDDAFSLEQAISLSTLDLSNNSLTGPLPNNLFSTVAAYSTLQFLYLENNQFTGILPFNNSTRDDCSLMDVWLYNNNLQGTIPPGFAQGWRNLTDLLLHGNPLLTGELEIPETTTLSAAPVAAATLAPGTTTNSTSTTTTSPSFSYTPATTTSPLPYPAMCKATWPLLERMTSDCNATLDEAMVVCPCCTECY